MKRRGLVRYVAIFLVLLFFAPAATLGADQGLHTRVKALKAEGRYRDAAALLEKAAEVAGGGRRTALLLDAARFLSWARDYEGSLGLYDRVLAEEPSNREALLGRARVLAWAGRREEAIKEYRRLLKENPDDREARLGMAKVLAWQKDYGDSLKEYGKVLEKDPEDGEAMLGLATTLWWKGDFNGALDSARRLLAIRPDDSEAAALEGKIRKARGPAVSVDYTDSNDSDNNDLEIYRVKGYYAPSKALRFDGGFSLFEAKRFDDSARARVFSASLRYRPGAKTAMRARLSVVDIDAPSTNTENLTGGISISRTVTGRLRTWLSWSRYMLLDTATLIRNNIRISEFAATSAYNLPSYFTATAGLTYGDYSDGNSMKGFFLDLHREFQYFRRGPGLRAGYRLDYRDFKKDLTSGYFDPSNFISNIIYLEAYGTTAGRRIEYEARAEAGTQNYNSKGEYTSAFYVRALYHVNRSLGLFGGYKYSRSALESAAGFRYEEFRLGVTYLF